MSDLLASSSPALWARALAIYPDALRALADSFKTKGANGVAKANRLLELDAFIWGDLGPRLENMEEPFLTHSELCAITEYKQLRGQFRISLSQKVASNAKDKVEEVTKAAMKAIQPWHKERQEARIAKASNPTSTSADDDITSSDLCITTSSLNVHQAILILDKGVAASKLTGKKGAVKSASSGGGLTGIGPATAAIILSLMDPSCPYFDDDVYVVAMNSDFATASAGTKRSAKGKGSSSSATKIAYTADGYAALLETIRSVASKIGWEPRRVGRAIWAVCISRKFGMDFSVDEKEETDADPDDGASRKRPKSQKS
ncbi:hypothetical protein HDU67_007800 [Dinochytrium kinnereticum]|nr:hypothetical protein HDU67_007800 [Dinochytrium kinnereticum]